jgi:hypothetical protein
VQGGAALSYGGLYLRRGLLWTPLHLRASDGCFGRTV